MKFIQELIHRVNYNTFLLDEENLNEISTRYVQNLIHNHLPSIMEKCRMAANCHQYSIIYEIEDHILITDELLRYHLKQEMGKELLIDVSYYYDIKKIYIQICWAKLISNK